MSKVNWNYVRTYDLEFALVLDAQTWTKTMKDMRVAEHSEFPSTAGCTHIFKTSRGPRRAIVTLQERPGLSGIQVAAVLAHEAIHIVQDIEEHIRETFSHEAEAYLLQHILQDLMTDYVAIKEKENVRSG